VITEDRVREIIREELAIADAIRAQELIARARRVIGPEARSPKKQGDAVPASSPSSRGSRPAKATPRRASKAAA